MVDSVQLKMDLKQQQLSSWHSPFKRSPSGLPVKNKLLSSHQSRELISHSTETIHIAINYQLPPQRHVRQMDFYPYPTWSFKSFW